MNFCVLPPEVTSAQLYSGAGPGPMLAAAAAWHGLGGELGSAANSFSSLTSGLTGGPWQGAAAKAMAGVATQYAQWLNAAAAHAGTAAAQAKAAAGIFEAAKAAITHPGAIAANRMQLRSLVRSNVFGFNTPAIAAAEGAYEAMWATNVTTLAGYHGGASALAAQLTSQALQPLPGQGASAAAANPAAGLGNLLKEDVTAISVAQSRIKDNLVTAATTAGTEIGAAGVALGSGDVGQAASDVADAARTVTVNVAWSAVEEVALVPALALYDVLDLAYPGAFG